MIKDRKVILTIALLLFTLIGTTAIVQAAVEGNFSSSYDGYDDQSSETSGHEITIDGTLTVRGNPAIDPVIRIKPGSDTVLDESSVAASVPATQAIEFEKRHTENSVELVLSGDSTEIPAGTEIQIRYVVYPTGVQKNTYQSGVVEMSFDRPNGERTTERFPITTEMENSPWGVIESLRNDLRTERILDAVSLVGWLGWLIGILGIAGYVLFGRSRNEDGPPSASDEASNGGEQPSDPSK